MSSGYVCTCLNPVPVNHTHSIMCRRDNGQEPPEEKPWGAAEIIAGKQLHEPTVDSVGKFPNWFIDGHRVNLIAETGIGSYRIKVFDVSQAFSPRHIHGVVYHWSGRIVAEWFEEGR